MVSARHIIQVSSYYPPHLGGQENAVHDLAIQLVGAGNHVRVLSSTAGGGQKGTSIEEGVVVNRLPAFVFGHAPIMQSFPIDLFRAAQAGSIVHLHIGQAFTPEMVWLVSRFRRFPYIAQLHIDFEPSGAAGVLLPLYKRLILKRVLRSASAIVTLNEQTLRTVRDKYGYRGDASILSNGIDEAYFKLHRIPLSASPPHTLHLLFVGRLSPQKNVVTFLDAVKRSKRNIHVDLVGDGEQYELIRRIIADNKLSNVSMHGKQPRREVMKFYQTCDALVMPSLYEAQPLVLLEAMAARIPIIGTDVIGVADHIAGAGIIVDPTAEGLAGGIDQYYRQYTHLSEMVQRGYKKAEKMRWEHTRKSYEALYDAVAAH
jgi:glycosyltransferase involved in cell wall biosynthesis